MPFTFDTTKPQTRDNDGGWTPLATGTYVMEIESAQVAPSPFEDDNGEHQEELTLTWKLAEWLPEYEAAGYEPGQKVFQRMRTWYGTGKRGDSKLKTFIDPLVAEGLIPAAFNVAGPDDEPNQGDLVGIRRRVMVENYAKTMGANKGQPGNRVLAVAPLQATRTVPGPAPVVTTSRTPAPAAPPRPAPRPTPSAIDPDAEDDLPLEGPTTIDDLQGVFEVVDALDVETLREQAPKFAPFTANSFWTKKDFSDRNEVQLRNDIKAMWTTILRKQAPVDANATLFPE
jgi:hypothetical protein